MSDFTITKKNGKEITADDVVVHSSGRILKYIEPNSHRHISINTDDISEIRRERRDWEGGPAFSDDLFHIGWRRPV